MIVRPTLVGVLLLVLTGLTPAIAAAQPKARPGRLSKDEVAALVPGLALEIVDRDGVQSRDARLVRIAALYVAPQSPPTPFVAPGQFTAQLHGYLKVPLKGDHAFRLEGRGTATLSINGERVAALEAGEKLASQTAEAALVRGYNQIEIDYKSQADGAAELRVWWSGSDFTWEPLPPDALFTPGNAATLVEATRQREGRELFATHHCAKCHAAGDGLTQLAALAMPEIHRDAPSLEGIGSRLNEAWMREWILDPQRHRPTATMPRLVERPQNAADLAAYLASLRGNSSPAQAAANDAALAEKGLKLFEDLGCIACHRTERQDGDDPFGRLPLDHAQAKFAPGKLAAFLAKPHEHYAWSRMPDFRLSGDEAEALAAYLESKAAARQPQAGSALTGNAARGKELFATIGCRQCHAAGGEPAKPRNVVTLPPRAPQRGCLAADAAQRGKAPVFPFDPEEQAALMSFLSGDRQSLLRGVPAEFAERQVKALNCVACHRRDGQLSVLTRVLEEEGEQGHTPEILPLLTWAGEKLEPEWTARLLAGQHDQRARQWLRARMPSFPAQAKTLAVGLSHQHGYSSEPVPRPVPRNDLATIGQQLLAEAGGLGCVKCHAVGSQPARAPFEAPGINLVQAAERLRPGYYPRWMLDPPRVDVLTKMPKFAADGKTTGLATVFDGDAARQYDAIWHYMQTLREPARR